MIYAGLMSGTSLDGISAVVVRFSERDAALYPELLAFTVTEYSAEQRARLASAMQQSSARDYCVLAADLGEWLARAANEVIAEAGVSRTEIRAIGSHGQTLWHEPGHSTWQLDAPAIVAERTGISVVSGFRARDMAAGGQGAPLVPMADAMLFNGGKWRALQNIGGIGNVTVVPPNGMLRSVRAFDTGPGVAVIDAVVRQLHPDRRYDEDGRIASQGSVNAGVVAELMTHDYFRAEPPKSTGRELFSPAYAATLIERVRALGGNKEDTVATATALTAASIADAYTRFIPEPIEEVLVSGGGARNKTLLGMIRDRVAPLPVVSFEERYFDGEAKEAVAFALLAHLHMERIPGNVPTATGASGPRVLGTLTPA